MTNVCTMPEVMDVMLIINKVIGALKILVPIIIIVMGMYSFFKATLGSNESKIKEAISLFMIKLFVGVAIFFIPTIVKSIAKIAAPNTNFTLCFMVDSKDEVYKAYASYAYKMLNRARGTLDKEDYENAAYYVSKMQDGSSKTSYEKKLEEIKELIGAKNTQNSNNSNSNTGSSNGNSSTGTGSGNITQNASSSYGDIFVGDSRTLGYSYQLSLRSTDAIYATTSGASKEFNSDFTKALSKINSDPSHRYNLVFNYGVNNLSQDWVNIYRNAINQVGNRANILIVSVNPCNDSIAKYCKNANVQALNNKLRSAFSSGYSNVRYCDTYTPFVNTPNYTSMIETISGVHYTKAGSTLIYNQIESCLKGF